MSIIGAAACYFAIVFGAGFIAGTIRTLLLAPAMNEGLAVLIELPIMIAISWWACGFVLRRMKPVPDLPARIAVGTIAFALMLAAETVVSLALAGLTFRQHLALYAALPAQLGLLGQLFFAAFPLIRRNTP